MEKVLVFFNYKLVHGSPSNASPLSSKSSNSAFVETIDNIIHGS